MQRFQPRFFWQPYFVLFLALALTACAAFYVAEAAHEQDRLRFERMADRTRDAMAARLRTYVAALRGSAGLIHSIKLQRFGTVHSRQGPVSDYLIGRAAFHNYVRQLRLQVDFPGIQGVGFTARVPPRQKDEFIAAVRREDADFQIWPELKTGVGPELHSIVYLEPMDKRNQAAIGYNMYSEVTRRLAMQKARDSGEAAASGKVLLKQEITPDKQAGFLIYVPVYRSSQVPPSKQARREQLIGFVYAPFRAGDFLKTLSDESTEERLLFQLYDDVAPATRQLLYQSASLPKGYAPQYHYNVSIQEAGRTWNLRMLTRPEFDRESNDFLVPFIIIAGFFVSMLLFAVTYTQAAAYHRAEQTAQELKQSEAKREKLLESEHEARLRAEEASRSKDEFLAIVSHELRTPLTSILGWASLIRNRTVDEKSQQSGLETIERNARAQSQLIEDLLDMSRLISGRINLEYGPVNLVPLLDAALDAARPAAQAKNIQLTRRFDINSGRVTGDEQRLQQVVSNLLTNAIKFTPKEGRVELSLRHVDAGIDADVDADKKGYFEISVQDNGIGMEPEFVPYAFERFRQADATSTRAHSGLGLGLSIVRQLVEMHGGAVRAHSEGQGRGSTFTVRLPATNESTVEANSLSHPQSLTHDGSEKESDALSGRLQNKKILVVEDEPDARQMIAAILQVHGAQVKAVESVAAALATLSAWQPDVLVSDLGLPEEDGYSLMRQLRSLPVEKGGATPAIALTAFARESDRVAALEAGFQRYLTKPISPAELSDAVGSLIDN